MLLIAKLLTRTWPVVGTVIGAGAAGSTPVVAVGVEGVSVLSKRLVTCFVERMEARVLAISCPTNVRVLNLTLSGCSEEKESGENPLFRALKVVASIGCCGSTNRQRTQSLLGKFLSLE